MWMPLPDEDDAANVVPDPAVDEPSVDEPAAEPVPARSPVPPPNAETAMDRLAALPQPGPPMALRAAWAASIALLVGFAVAAFVWREPVVQAWPQSGWVLGPQTVSAPDAHPPAPQDGHRPPSRNAPGLAPAGTPNATATH
jgi:hypothetical protein